MGRLPTSPPVFLAAGTASAAERQALFLPGLLAPPLGTSARLDAILSLMEARRGIIDAQREDIRTDGRPPAVRAAQRQKSNCAGILADGSIIGVDPGEYCAWGFCNLVVNSWMRIGPVRGLSAKR